MSKRPRATVSTSKQSKSSPAQASGSDDPVTAPEKCLVCGVRPDRDGCNWAATGKCARGITIACGPTCKSCDDFLHFLGAIEAFDDEVATEVAVDGGGDEGSVVEDNCHAVNAGAHLLGGGVETIASVFAKENSDGSKTPGNGCCSLN